MSTAQIVAALPDPAVLLDRSFTIIEHNAAAESLFGKAIHGLALEHVSRDPELITSVTIVLNAGDRKTVRLAWLGAIERHLLATISPVGNRANGTLESSANAEPEFVLITIKDLSDQHRLLEMRTDFIANASHELRTPLASVRGFIETLQGPARDDPAARTRFLGIMAAQAERMTRLIDDLLLLSRVEEKAYLAPTGRVDLDEVIADVVRTLLPIADERRVSIIVQRTELAGQVVGERDEIFQVFQNLIENAVKYGRDGGMVTVARTKADGATSPIPRTTITISDDGPGIAPEHLPRLTERFYRVNADQSRKIGGTGLGLAIVKHVLNRHQGELQIVSTVGVGTTVRVTLPTSIR
ncbi:MAG: two-component sensor histidine kinase [Hyphomicrobium sp.]|nr:two-component sensor histidine kinase [Hyphomicrobium sp.]